MIKSVSWIILAVGQLYLMHRINLIKIEIFILIRLVWNDCKVYMSVWQVKHVDPIFMVHWYDSSKSFHS